MEKAMIDDATRDKLLRLASQYETAEFLRGDPSWFMHQVGGEADREAVAFLASCLSYGNRRQFMPRIQWLVERAGGRVDAWVRFGAFADDLPQGDGRCFYRLYTVGQMHAFLQAYRHIMLEYGSLGSYVLRCAHDGLSAVEAICRVFMQEGQSAVVPHDARSACKRVCMFLRWMVRSGSPVDLGLWADFIDRRTLIMPLDTHVLSESRRLGLLQGGSVTMAAARKLTHAMADIFPDDPLRGDFALFGYGINSGNI